MTVVNIELPREDVRFLADHVAREVSRMNNELVHTDKRELQGELARDVERLTRIAEELRRLV
jgi:hypothetical protein